MKIAPPHSYSFSTKVAQDHRSAETRSSVTSGPTWAGEDAFGEATSTSATAETLEWTASLTASPLESTAFAEPTHTAALSGGHHWTALGALAGMTLGAAVGSSFSGALGPAIAVGMGVGAAVGKVADLYTVPDKLYHFTSTEAASAITESGELKPKPGNHGVGVYTTRFPSRSMAALQRAKSTDMVFTIESGSYEVRPTPIPGTFVITQPVPVNEPQVTLETAGDSHLADWLHQMDWRERMNPLGPRSKEGTEGAPAQQPTASFEKS